jgi:hypothetical protein
LVNLFTVKVRMCTIRNCPSGQIRQNWVFEETARNVNSEAVDTAIEPEPQNRFEGRMDARVCPIEIGLFWRVDM